MKTIKISSIFLALLLAACGGGGEPKNKKELLKEKEKQLALLNKEVRELREQVNKEGGDSTEAKSVASLKLAPAPFIHTIEVLGAVDSDENVKLGSQSGGSVTRVLVKVGDKVHKGQLLAETDNATLAQSMQEIRTQQALAQTLYEKQERLWKQNIGSEVQYLSAKTNLEALNNRIATMNQQLAMSRIVSPINGTVDAVDVKPGQVLVPGMPVISVVNKSNLKLKAELAEAYIGKVKKGDKVIVTIPDLGLEFETRIKYAGQAINQLDRTFNIEMAIDKKYFDQLAPNMVARVNIVDYQAEKALLLPVNVVQKDAKNKFVYVAEEKGKKKIAVKRLVKTGQTQNGKVEILEGLKEGDEVITSGFQNLQENDAVNLGK
jgi:RND family efflux transporter MFP subunit